MPKVYGDRWRYVRDLGQGGQALVCLVEDERGELKGMYALKRLRGTASQKGLERFHREVEALKSVVHPGIVRLVDHSHLDDKASGNDSQSLFLLTQTRSQPRD